MKHSLRNAGFHAILLALMLLGLFMVRSMYQPLYYNELIYNLLILLITLASIIFYYSSLIPNRQQEEGTMSWYLTRGWAMSFTGALLATLLVGTYAYQLDEGYFERRMRWEEQRLDGENISPKVEDILLEQQQLYQTYHFEEITVLFLGGISALVGVFGASIFFRLSHRPGNNNQTISLS